MVAAAQAHPAALNVEFLKSRVVEPAGEDAGTCSMECHR